jgi:hypothetical protein
MFTAVRTSNLTRLSCIFISNKQLYLALKDFKRSSSAAVAITALAAVELCGQILNPFTISLHDLDKITA